MGSLGEHAPHCGEDFSTPSVSVPNIGGGTRVIGGPGHPWQGHPTIKCDCKARIS